MANLLDQFTSGVTHLGSDAQAAVNKALSNTAQLAGSGVNAQGKIFGPIAEQFGHDPQAFVLNVAKATSKTAAKLLQRVADRNGKLSYTFDTPHGKRKVTAKPPTSAPANQIALTLALASMDAPATMIEEAGRMSAGLPVKERGLSGFTVFPVAMSGGRALTGGEGGAQERGLFLVDDAAILAIVVPIIGAIAVAVLPGLIAAAGSIVQGIIAPGPSKEQQVAAAKDAEKQQQQQTMVTVGVVAGIVLVTGVGIFLAVRHKKKAA